MVILEGKVTTTKRGVLQKLAKIYDPLYGLASPLTLQGKFMYREVCQTKSAWDAPLGNELVKRWLRWEQLLPSKATAPQTLAKFQENIESIEFHAFRHTSAKGVSSAVYAIVRQISGVTAKARLVKQGLTIPRLELVSARMAANLVTNVEEALDGFLVEYTLLVG